MGGLARRDGVGGETVAAAAGIWGDEADGTCRDDRWACQGRLRWRSRRRCQYRFEIGGEVSTLPVLVSRKFSPEHPWRRGFDLIFARASQLLVDRRFLPATLHDRLRERSLTFRGRSAGCAVAIAGAGI